MRVLEPYFNENFDETYSHLKNKAKDILTQQDTLSEIVQLVGKESLSEDQKVIMRYFRNIPSFLSHWSFLFNM